jgi:hypothetical protein
MVKFSFSCRSDLEPEDVDALLRLARTGDGIPMGDFEEPATDARGGMKFLEVEEAGRWHREEPDKVSIMANHSKRETGKVEELRGANSGSKSGEESVEGEPVGEAEARGRGGCQGEPLRGLPRCCGMIWQCKWIWHSKPKGRAWRRPGVMSTMSVQAKLGQGSGGPLELVLGRGRVSQADGEAIAPRIIEVG